MQTEQRIHKLRKADFVQVICIFPGYFSCTVTKIYHVALAPMVG